MYPIESWTALIKIIVVKCHFILFVACIPVLILSITVSWAINDIGLYQKGFDKYHISLKTGISYEDLTNVGKQIQRYFNSLDEPLLVKTQIFGDERTLFNEREVDHMQDVKNLIHLVYGGMLISGIYVSATIICSSIGGPSCRFYTRPLITAYGGALTILSIVGLGLLSLTNFDDVFLIFHQISFSNDLWMLDPRTDYLIMLFPLGFWFDVTMRIALVSIIVSIITVAIATSIQGVTNARNRPPHGI